MIGNTRGKRVVVIGGGITGWSARGTWRAEAIG
jgi:hypothetical protein